MRLPTGVVIVVRGVSRMTPYGPFGPVHIMTNEDAGDYQDLTTDIESIDSSIGQSVSVRSRERVRPERDEADREHAEDGEIDAPRRRADSVRHRAHAAREVGER